MNYLDDITSIRTLRRALGINQKELADKLGVTQAIISRWETGTEPIPKARAIELRDIFLNVRDVLHPVIARLCRRSANLSVISQDRRYLRISKLVATAYELNSSEVEGTAIDRWFRPLPADQEKMTLLNKNIRLDSEALYLESLGEQLGPLGEAGPVVRGLWTLYTVDMPDYGTVILNQPSSIMEPTNEPLEIRRVITK